MQQAEEAIRDLAAKMCRAPGPPGALLEAARACISRLPLLTYVGLVVMARDRQTVRYNTLHSSRPEAARLGAIATANAAAGIAVDMKELVHVRDVDAGDLGLEDLQYFKHEHSARSFIAVPLVVSHAALGALCCASSQAHAFAGDEEWLQVVAALCSPYLTLMRSHQELLALEGLVTQMMPVRVALQLRATAATAQAAQQQQQQQQQSSAAEGEAAAALQQERQQLLGGQDGETSSSSTINQQSGFHLRRQQQQQQPPGPGVRQVQQQQCQQRLAMGRFLTFKQPQLEVAYKTYVHRQWQQLLDGLFLLLSVLSAVGGRFSRGLTGDVIIDGSLCVVLLVVCVRLLHQLYDQPTALYLRWRLPTIAAVRLLRVMLFCIEAWQLPRHVFDRRRVGPAGGLTLEDTGWELVSGHLRQFTNWSQAEVAGSGILLMQGLTGHLPLLLHAVVQLVSAAAVIGVLWAATVSGRGASAAAAAAAVPLPAVLAQLLAGWLVSVAVVAFVEWRTRSSFLRKIR